MNKTKKNNIIIGALLGVVRFLATFINVKIKPDKNVKVKSW